MPKEITLINWTGKAVAESKTSQDRIDKGRELLRQMGGGI